MLFVWQVRWIRLLMIVSQVASTSGHALWSRDQRQRKSSTRTSNSTEARDFSEEEIIQFKTDLTGVFPMNLVISVETIEKLKEKFIPPISEFDEGLQICWFIPRKLTMKKQRKEKEFWILEVIDSNNETED